MSTAEKTVKAVKTWRKTRVQGLYLHRNGRFFSRTYLNGKENWTPLETTVQSVAEEKHAKLRGDTRKHRKATKAAASGDLTFGQALERFRVNRLDLSARKKALKPSSLRYQDEIIAMIVREWEGIEARPLKRILKTDCHEWANRIRQQVCASRYNGAVGIVRSIFNEGIKVGVIVSNPADSLKFNTVPKTKRDLPSREQFEKVVATMRKGGARFSVACADFVAGLAYTGMRLREAGHVVWSDVDMEKGTLRIGGNPLTGTKNMETPTVPLNPSALALFRRMKNTYPTTGPKDRVFRVREAQKALDRATKIVGCPRLTHHSLRSLFATTCIEVGVDIPTIAGWLNHKDGGVLLMETYGQLRNDHSKAAAAKVTF